MARLLAVTLGCISLLYLQLPGTLSRRLRLALPGEHAARTPSGGLQPQPPAPWPVVRKPGRALQPQGRASLATAVGRPVRNGPHRPGVQLLRAGCVLGTCRVQNLSHRLWQLIASAGPRDAAPVDPSNPFSYG